MEFSEKTAEKYGGTVRHIPMIRATLFYSQEEYNGSVVGENTVVFSDDYFQEQWEDQAADAEEPSMLELFVFPGETEQQAWKEIKKYADEKGIEVFQPDIAHERHAACYNKNVFLQGQRMYTLFLLSSKLFILITLFVSGIFIMAVKNLSELSSYVRRYEFLNSMGMRKKAQKKNLSFELQGSPNIALIMGVCLAAVYALTFGYQYFLSGQELEIEFWKYWGGIVFCYVVVELVIQRVFVVYMYRRLKRV